ncbi:MAG TPA: SDR family oxidoreductase [Burkholderiaceae bacterium]|nr:SDR family oxidoreductase [Burkholderiaceae bacterium]
MHAPSSRKDISHERIVAVAARAIRGGGFQGVGVADIMKESGPTHGGFQARFRNRDALLAEALERAGQDTAAREQFSRVFSMEIRHRTITVNGVSPGPTDTPVFRTRPAEFFEGQQKMTTMGRIGRIEETVNVVAFLAGPGASWVTGQNIRVNGGRGRAWNRRSVSFSAPPAANEPDHFPRGCLSTPRIPA